MKLEDIIGNEYWMATPARIARDTGLSQSAKLLFVVLLNYCVRFDSQTVHPGQTALAQAIGLGSRRQLLRATKELEERGLIVTRREGQAGGSVIVYFVRSVSTQAGEETVKSHGEGT